MRIATSSPTSVMSSESQPEPVTAARCEHWYGFKYESFEGYKPSRVPKAEFRHDSEYSIWFEFCPNCGKKISQDALFPPSVEP